MTWPLPPSKVLNWRNLSARDSFEEEVKGPITPGKLADMVVLSADPTKSPPEQIKDIKVEITIIDGKVVWQA